MSLTRRGAAVLIAGASSLAAGLAFGHLGAAAIGLTLLALATEAATRRAPVDATISRRVDTDTLREGGRIVVELQGSVPPGVELREAFPPGLSRVEGSAPERRYVLEARAPGRWTLGPLTLVHADALGLARHETTLGDTTRITVYPQPELPRGAPGESRLSLPLGGRHATGMAGPGSDFYALRGYQEGDTMRDVNWRASARTGKGLVVNQREKESQTVVTYFIDARAIAGIGTRTRNAHVLSLRALATLGTLDLRRRDRPRLIVYGEGVSQPILARAGDTSLASLLDPLLDASVAGRVTLDEAVRSSLSTLRPRAPVFIISHLLDDARATAAVAALRALDQSVTALVIEPGPILALAAPDPEAAARLLRDQAASVEGMRAQGATIVRWHPEQPLSLALAEAMLA